VAQREQEEKHRHRRNMVARQRANWVRVQVRAAPNVRRRRVEAEGLKPNNPGSRLEQANVGPALEVLRLEFINRSRRLLVEARQVKRAAKEKEDRAPMVSRPRRNEAARLAQPSTARHRDNRKAEKENQQKKPHRPDPNNSSVIATTAPERKFRSRFCCSGVCVKRQALAVASASTIIQRSARRLAQRL
jgi:hypothetical protein